jgi:hypothetical protein
MPSLAIQSHDLAIGQPLAFHRVNGSNHPCAVREFARVPSKFKFTSVFRHMFAADMMLRTDDAALEQAEKGLARVDMRKETARPS